MPLTTLPVARASLATFMASSASAEVPAEAVKRLRCFRLCLAMQTLAASATSRLTLDLGLKGSEINYFVSYFRTDVPGGVGGGRHDAHGGGAAPGLPDLREEWGSSPSIFRHVLLTPLSGNIETPS